MAGSGKGRGNGWRGVRKPWHGDTRPWSAWPLEGLAARHQETPWRGHAATGRRQGNGYKCNAKERFDALPKDDQKRGRLDDLNTTPMLEGPEKHRDNNRDQNGERDSVAANLAKAFSNALDEYGAIESFVGFMGRGTKFAGKTQASGGMNRASLRTTASDWLNATKSQVLPTGPRGRDVVHTGQTELREAAPLMGEEPRELYDTTDPKVKVKAESVAVMGAAMTATSCPECNFPVVQSVQAVDRVEPAMIGR